MLMHISEDISRRCFQPEVSFLNAGNQFDSNKKDPHEFLSIFRLDKIFPFEQSCRKSHTQINDKWYTPKRVQTLEKLYRSITLAPNLQSTHGTYDVLVHARWERDWLSFMCNKAKRCPPMSQLTRLVPADAFVVIGRRNTSPAVLKRLGAAFKGFVPVNASLSYTENAAVHFFQCVHARVFWGNSYSTFARGVARMRRLHGRLSYAYDCSSDPNVQDVFIFSCGPHTIRREIVIARFEESIDWVHDLPIDTNHVTVYNKGHHTEAATKRNVKWIDISNVDREQHTFIQHIAQNYNSLADITLFLQADISDHNGVQNDVVRILTQPLSSSYGTFGEQIHADDLGCPNHCGLAVEAVCRMIGFSNRCHPPFQFSAGGMFYASRYAIRQHQLEKYTKMKKMITAEARYTRRDNLVGFVFERLWMTILKPNRSSEVSAKGKMQTLSQHTPRSRTSLPPLPTSSSTDNICTPCGHRSVFE